MKTQLIIAFLGIFLLSACNKVQHTAKTLDGTWKIYSYAQTISGGFVHYYETEGTITFTTRDDGTFDYQEDYTYYTATDTIHSTRKGTGILNGKKIRNYDLTFTDPAGIVLEGCQIRVLTKDDLKIQHQESSGGHTYVLYKD